MTTVEKMMAYEAGNIGDANTPLDEQEDLIEFFQELVDSGLAWQLQGHYGRAAANLIRLGYVTAPQQGA